MTNLSLLDRLADKFVITDDDCWQFTGAERSNGYGQIQVDGRPQLPHRIAYELLVGPIPQGLQLDHLCRNRRCINPDHLEPVTHTENRRRAMKDHCAQGHPFSSSNTYVKPDGARVCRTCNASSARAYRQRMMGGG